MKLLNLQKNPIIPSNRLIQELEEILYRNGYNGSNVAFDIGVHHQRFYEIPNEGAVYLKTTDNPSPQSFASQVSFLGFNESESIVLRRLEEEVVKLAESYLTADTDLIGQGLLNVISR